MSADPIQQLRNTLFQIPSIPQLRQAQLVLAQRLQQEIGKMQQTPQLQQAMIQTLAEMLQGMGSGFRALQGGRLFFRRLPRGLSAFFISVLHSHLLWLPHAFFFVATASSVVSSIIALCLSRALSPQDRSPSWRSIRAASCCPRARGPTSRQST